MQEYGLKGTKNKKSALYYALFMILLIVASFQLSTQVYAYYLGYQEALGDYWFIVLDIAWYPTWSILSWKDYVNTSHLADKAIVFGQMLFLAPQFLFFGLYFAFKMQKGNKILHGSATWAKEDEIKTMGYFSGQGVYVGAWQKHKNIIRYLRHNGPEHILCFAPTRSGKGVGLILPTLLSWLDSSLILDIKGENWALTSGFRKSIGHKVLKFDPTDVSGLSCAFNPLEEIELNTFEAIQDIQNLALMMIDPDGKGLSDHWTKAGFGFFGGMLMHCCVMKKCVEKRTATLEDITLMMSGFDMPIEEVFDEMVETDHSLLLSEVFENFDEKVGSAIHAFIASTATEMKQKPEKEAGSIVSTVLVNISLYRDPVINLNTRRSDFKIADLMNSDTPVDLYLVLNPANIDRIRPLIRLMVDMIIRKVCKEMSFKDGTSVKGYKHRLLLMLDEFTSLGKLPIIEKAIAYIAGYGGKMYLIVQDITQLNSAYGKDNALMANCHVRIAYAPNTPETAKLLSDMTGKTTVVDTKKSKSFSKGGQSSSVNVAETGRPLLTPDECSRLPAAIKDSDGKVIAPGHMLIFTAGQNPIYGVQILYFKDPVFIERAKIEAPTHSDSLYYDYEYSDSITIQPKVPDESEKIIEIPIINKEKTSLKFENFLE